jgi:glycolate oxidase FAD binding subunit
MGTGTSGSAAETIPAALANACADLAVASDLDAIGGRQAHFVAAPASTAEAAAVMRAAADLGLIVVPRGSGSRLHWGAPPTSCDLIVDTRRLDRVLEHAAGDLVVSVQAGVHLDVLAEVLATAGQRLALDAFTAGQHAAADNGAGTIGGAIATGAAGPLRYRFGSPRDLLIGITVVRADGTVAKSGGKVVKNVAGYDLGKLFAGSYGTLGLITEATFRLHPKPESSTWITAECSAPEHAAEVVRIMADAPLAPSAIELDWPSASASIAVAVLLEGDQASVDDRAERMASLLARGTVGPATRETVGQPSAQPKRADGSSAHPALGADTTMIKIAFWAGQLSTVLRSIRESAAEHGLGPAIAGSAAAGVLEVCVDHDASPDAVAAFVEALRAGLVSISAVGGVVPRVATAVVVCAPTEVCGLVDLWGPVQSLRLMRAVKDQFDPEHRLAPGRFAGGI